jgi:hypothetical protein
VQCDDLQDAFDESFENDVITLDDGQECTGEFTLPQYRIVFQGASGGATEVMKGDDEGRILEGTDVGTTVIRNLNFEDGDLDSSGSAILIEGNSAPMLSGLTIIGNDSGDRAPVTIATNTGGGTVTVEESTFEDNSAAQGGGLLINTAHSIVLHHNTFTGNVAEEEGGGAVLDLDVEDNVVERGIQGGVPAVATATITDNTFSGNRVEMTPNSIPVLLGGGLAIVTADSDSRSVVQSGNTFSDNAIVPSFFFNGPDRTTEGPGFGGYFAGGGEYTEASVLSTNDRFVKNSIEAPTQPTQAIIQDGGFSAEMHGGGLAVSGRSLTLEGRNLVAAGNEIAFGQGGGVSSDRGFERIGVLGRGSVAEGSKGSNNNSLMLLDSTIDANDAGDGTGSGIYGNYDDDLLVTNGIVFDNTSSQGRQIDGFDDGGTIDISFTDYCAEEEVAPPSRVAAAPAPGEGNICVDPQLVDPQLVDPPNGDVHQKQGLSLTLDAGSNALVPEGLTTDWDRPTADPRIADSGTDGARVDMGADELVVPAPPGGHAAGAGPGRASGRRGARRPAAFVRVEARFPHPPARAARQDRGLGHGERQRQAGQGDPRAPAQGPRDPARPPQGQDLGEDLDPAQGRQEGHRHAPLQHVHSAPSRRRAPARLIAAPF